MCRSTALLVSMKKWWLLFGVSLFYLKFHEIMKIAMCRVDSHRSLVQCQCSSACGTDRWYSNVCTHLFDAVLHRSGRWSTMILPSQKHVCLDLSPWCQNFTVWIALVTLRKAEFVSALSQMHALLYAAMCYTRSVRLVVAYTNGLAEERRRGLNDIRTPARKSS